MTADEWFNECLLIENGKQVTRWDVLNLSIPRERLIRELFPEIQRTRKVEIPAPRKGEPLQRYHVRVCEAVRKSGATVVMQAK